MCGDIKTFKCIMRVKSESIHAMDWVITYPGDWHILFHFQDVLKIFWDAGLKTSSKMYFTYYPNSVWPLHTSCNYGSLPDFLDLRSIFNSPYDDENV